jgi:hypothetical protein
MTEKIKGIIKAFGYVCLFCIIFCGFHSTGGLAAGKSGPATGNASTVTTFPPDDFVDVIPSWWQLLDVMPLDTGSPITFSNSSLEITLNSDTYVILDDFTSYGIWAHVKDLEGNNNNFSFSLISALPKGWEAPSGGPTQPLPGKEGDIKFVLPRCVSSEKNEGTFTYEVESDQYRGTLNITFTVIWLPQISSSLQTQNNATVEGTITDAATGNPIPEAHVTLWLGYNTRIMPHDMIETADSDGFYRMSCWDVDVLNNFYSPYLSVPGYMLVVQKKGYRTYVHNTFVKPQQSSPITLDVSLIPLETPVNYELKWETALSSPGVWGIAVTDAWDRFAVAMGKHPDSGDPATLPTSIPFLDNEGNILWKKSLDDQSWAIDVASDGSYVACSTHASGTNSCYLWDAFGNEVWKKNIVSQSTTIKFSNDNRYIATGPSGGNKSFILYNTLTGAEEWSYDMGRIRVRQTAFTYDGQHVLLGPPLQMFTLGGTRVWRRNEDTGLPYIIRPTTDRSQIVVPDKGGCLSMFNGNGKLMWRKELRVLTYGGMSTDGSVVIALSHNGNLYCYNVQGELQWYRFVPGSENGGGAGHDGIDVTPDGKYIIVGGGNYNTVLYDSDGNVLWRHTGDAPIDISEHPYWHSVMNVRISEDGEKIVSGYGKSDPRLCYFEKVADATAPTVNSTSPGSSSTGVAITTSASATFSEAMDPSTVTTDTFTLSHSESNILKMLSFIDEISVVGKVKRSLQSNIPGTVSYSGTTATFTPSSNLSNNIAYTAKITTGVKDIAGNNMASDYSWSFTTVSASDESETEEAKKGGCAIATACFGSAMAQEVQILCTFRDKYLMTNPTGRKIVGLYYKLSPDVADFIRDKEQIKAFVRICLRPFVWTIKKIIK